MPFVKQCTRKALDEGMDPMEAGDFCYRWYKMFMREWRQSPRWATADRLYSIVRHKDSSLQEQRAKELAWQVFFNLHVMRYERKKQKKNGDI